MSSRELILNKIKTTNKVQEQELPVYDNYGITYEDKFEQFTKAIQSVGGDALECRREDLDKVIKDLYPDEKTISSNVGYTMLDNLNPNDQEDPHDLKEIDLAVVQGEFAVAENGAVWMKNSDNRHRVLYFIAQNIVIVVEKKAIYNNMHEAYKHINFNTPGYGTFISGPSKTADIEQSLVIGAHGPKTGYVIFVE